MKINLLSKLFLVVQNQKAVGRAVRECYMQCILQPPLLAGVSKPRLGEAMSSCLAKIHFGFTGFIHKLPFARH